MDVLGNVKKSLTVILPAYNEEESLETCVNELIIQLDRSIDDYQVIIVDDGSVDNTLNCALKLKQKYQNINVISNIKNSGIGYSYKKALEQVSTTYVTWLPTDGEIRSKELLESFEYINTYHCIITYPVNSKGTRTLFRYWLSKIYQSIFRFLFVSDIYYFNGVTLFRTSILKKIVIDSKGFTFTAESVVKFLSKNKELENLFIQLPINLTPREKGSASAIKLSVLFDVSIFIIKLRYFLFIRNLTVK